LRQSDDGTHKGRKSKLGCETNLFERDNIFIRGSWFYAYSFQQLSDFFDLIALRFLARMQTMAAPLFALENSHH